MQQPRDDLSVHMPREIMMQFAQAVRRFRRRPALSLALLVTLTLGIGANTAIFSVVRAVLLRPLPYAEPERLVFAWRERVDTPSSHVDHGILTGAHVIEWRRRPTAFTSVAAIDSWEHNTGSAVDLVHADGAERLRGAFVTPNFFDLLGVNAAIGRTFDSTDGATGHRAIVISDAFWRRRFGADLRIVGQTVDLMRGREERERYTILGVLPPGFRFTYPLETEVWGMLPWAEIEPTRALLYELIARLKPGTTLEQAQAELTTIAQDISRGYGLPENRVRQNFALVEAVKEHVAGEVRAGMALLFAAGGVVMLIACVNVALLMLALVVDRRRELAVRAAIGARRADLVRLVLGESAIPAGAGTLLGVVIAWIGLPALRALVPPAVPRGDEVTLDPIVLLFAAVLGLATALACGVAPAWHAYRSDPQAELRSSGAAATGDRRVANSRRAIVTMQVAVVLMLVVSAALLLRSFWSMHRVDLGFAGEGVITMEMRLLNPKYRQPDRIAAFQRDVMERVRALPGVQQTSMTSSVPLRGVDFRYVLRAVGGTRRRSANMRPVDPEYFDLMRIPLLAGRLFTPADDERAPRVAIVSQAYARDLFGDESPIGRRLDLEPGSAEIVGLVGDVRHAAVTEPPRPAVYFPRAQHPTELICLVVRPAPGSQGMAAAIRAAVASVDPEQPVEKVTTLDRIVRESTAEERFYTVATVGFAAVALLLAVAGLAGVVARTVTERTREIGIRLALGAEPRQLVRLAVGRGMQPVTVGLGLGLIGAWAASRLLTRFLFEVSPLDPLAYAAAIGVLAGATLLACYLPARRARRLEAMALLRSE